ncbi:hypothetical protein ACFYPC_34010 [Streptomyces sp. NPDC005808]|uniref:hypothetical protein n=1 Tax=Streptomyces sp. NPDC005808 TaxID=3364734 RepID=UPI0036C2DD2D
MMPDHATSRHACQEQDTSDNTRTPTFTSRGPFRLIEAPQDHEVDATASRQLRRAGDFLSAARYMVRHHPKAGPTTLRLAAAFASRMHRSQHGHFAFNISATVQELGLSRRTVLNHARYLRELGLIAWVEHGSKRNSVRTRHGDAWQPGHGYRGTATLYAPVAPPIWDHAQGHRIHGRGYRARLIGVTEAGRTRAIAAARHTARKAGHQRSGRCTPSVVVTSAPSHLQVVERGKKNTPRTRKQRPLARRTPSWITPTDCHQAIDLTEKLQREVWWLYGACSRRLAFALRPLIQAGWTAPQLIAELSTWGVPAQLQDPAAYIHHELARRQRLAELPPTTEPPAHDAHADTGGIRYEAMLRDRARRHAPAWQHYAEQLRPALRRELAQGRQQRRQQTALREYRPTLREDEETFLASLPLENWADSPTPREIYAARARGHAPARGQSLPATDDTWLAHLREHAEAARAWAALRAAWATEDARLP